MPVLPATWYSKYKFWANGKKSGDCKPACKRHADVFPVVASLRQWTKMLSHALLSHCRMGGIFCSKGTYRVLKHDKKQVFDSFFERGILCIQPESALTSGKRRRRVSFFFLWRVFEINLCFMVLWWHLKVGMIWHIWVKPLAVRSLFYTVDKTSLVLFVSKYFHPSSQLYQKEGKFNRILSLILWLTTIWFSGWKRNILSFITGLIFKSPKHVKYITLWFKKLKIVVVVNCKSLHMYMQKTFVTLKYKTILIKKYHIKLHLEVVRGRWKTYGALSLFLGIYRSFSFPR